MRRIVTALAAVMVVGMLVIVGLMIARLAQTPAMPLPEGLTLPEGERAQAVTVTRDWFLVVTETGELLQYGRDSGSLLRRISLD